MNGTVDGAAAAIRQYTSMVPEVALTLGSGLGQFADQMEIETQIPYAELPGFPVSTAPGHDGRFLFGRVDGVPVVCMKGRIHYYEGYSMEQVVLPVRVMHALGAQVLFLTNAAGSLRLSCPPGTLNLVTDHISCFVPNPLIGPNDEEEGVRFPDMTQVYDPGLREIIRRCAAENGIPLQEGVYVQLTGPSYESPAEIRMLQTIGADLVGMSTVVEAITARHMGMRVCCVSLATNYAAGLSGALLSGEEVIEAGNAAAPRFLRLVRTSIGCISRSVTVHG